MSDTQRRLSHATGRWEHTALALKNVTDTAEEPTVSRLSTLTITFETKDMKYRLLQKILNVVKKSRTIKPLNVEYNCDVSTTESVSIIRD